MNGELNPIHQESGRFHHPQRLGSSGTGWRGGDGGGGGGIGGVEADFFVHT